MSAVDRACESRTIRYRLKLSRNSGDDAQIAGELFLSTRCCIKLLLGEHTARVKLAFGRQAFAISTLTPSLLSLTASSWNKVLPSSYIRFTLDFKSTLTFDPHHHSHTLHLELAAKGDTMQKKTQTLLQHTSSNSYPDESSACIGPPIVRST
jgi:hypothetical protein